MRDGLVRLAPVIQGHADAVLCACLSILLAGGAGIGEDYLEAALGVRKVAAAKDGVGPPDPAEQGRITVASKRRQLPGIGVGSFGFVEAVQLAVDAREAPLRGARGKTDRWRSTDSGTRPWRPARAPTPAGPPAGARETRPVLGALPTSWPIPDLTPAAGRWRVAAIRTSDAKPAFLMSPSV